MPPNMNQQDTKKPLEQFGTDLTALAREGKLDPVIGRDEEIRRTMQISSRASVKPPLSRPWRSASLRGTYRRRCRISD